MAATGHGLALGAIMLLAGDVRVGPNASGSKARFGLNEVAIGMTLPMIGLELARQRMPPAEFTKCVTQAKVCAPDDALHVGFLDLLANSSEPEAVVDLAIAEARRIGGYVKQPAFAKMKLMERDLAIQRVRPSMEDLERMVEGAKAAM
jgi:enoyl-CoA hydratase